jgi:hypothetical protein
MFRMQWDCGACGHVNGHGLVCDACGVARRSFDDPPVDIPRRPAWGEIGAAYLAGTYALLALGGLIVLASPRLLAAIGLAEVWIWMEVALASAAAYASTLHAVFLRRFNQAMLEVPRSVRTGSPFDAVVTLVPYETLERVWVSVELLDRDYQTVRRNGRETVRTRSRVMERLTLQSGEVLPGRRQHRFVATFHAPIPSVTHSSVKAEIAASILAFFGPLVPGLSHHARNLRSHGGYFVRARVRTGIWRRSYEQQVVSVAVPAHLMGRVAGTAPQVASAESPAAGAASGSGTQP